MTAVLVTAGVVAVLALAAGSGWWIVQRFRDQDRRIAELGSHVSDLGVVADVIDNAEEHPRRRRLRAFRAVEVAVPVTLLAGVAMAASAIASRGSDENAEPRLTPTTIPRPAPPAERDLPVMPDAATLPTMRPPGAPRTERSTEAEDLPAPPQAPQPVEQGDGGGGAGALPPSAGPPSQPPPGDEPLVAVELPEPTGTPEVADETEPAPLVDLDVGVLDVTIERA